MRKLGKIPGVDRRRSHFARRNFVGAALLQMVGLCQATIRIEREHSASIPRSCIIISIVLSLLFRSSGADADLFQTIRVRSTCLRG